MAAVTTRYVLVDKLMRNYYLFEVVLVLDAGDIEQTGPRRLGLFHGLSWLFALVSAR